MLIGKKQIPPNNDFWFHLELYCWNTLAVVKQNRVLSSKIDGINAQLKNHQNMSNFEHKISCFENKKRCIRFLTIWYRCTSLAKRSKEIVATTSLNAVFNKINVNFNCKVKHRMKKKSWCKISTRPSISFNSEDYFWKALAKRSTKRKKKCSVLEMVEVLIKI